MKLGDLVGTGKLKGVYLRSFSETFLFQVISVDVYTNSRGEISASSVSVIAIVKGERKPLVRMGGEPIYFEVKRGNEGFDR